MYRVFEIEKPIKYTAINGNMMTYNVLVLTYEVYKGQDYFKLVLTNKHGCPSYMEIELTTPEIKVPSNYYAFRPNQPSSKIIIPELLKQNVIKVPDNIQSIYHASVDHPIFHVVPVHERKVVKERV